MNEVLKLKLTSLNSKCRKLKKNTKKKTLPIRFSKKLNKAFTLLWLKTNFIGPK